MLPARQPIRAEPLALPRSGANPGGEPCVAEVGPGRVRGAMAAGSAAVLARALEALGEGRGVGGRRGDDTSVWGRRGAGRELGLTRARRVGCGGERGRPPPAPGATSPRRRGEPFPVGPGEGLWWASGGLPGCPRAAWGLRRGQAAWV